MGGSTFQEIRIKLGLNSGALTEPLYHRQDSLLFVKLNQFVPSQRKQRFLRKFVKWFNRDINNCVIPPFRQELWGQAQYSDSIFNYIAPAYQRTLYLHSAHDLGHALQDLMLVGCSSLAVWGDKTEDGQLLIGRNFDFYLSDDFATEKVVRFVRPEEGIPFMRLRLGRNDRCALGYESRRSYGYYQCGKVIYSAESSYAYFAPLP